MNSDFQSGKYLEEFKNKVREKHNIALSDDDPVLIIATLFEFLLERSVDRLDGLFKDALVSNSLEQKYQNDQASERARKIINHWLQEGHSIFLEDKDQMLEQMSNSLDKVCKTIEANKISRERSNRILIILMAVQTTVFSILWIAG